MEHKWKSQRAGGDPANADSYEMVTSCDSCGAELSEENEHEECPPDDFDADKIIGMSVEAAANELQKYGYMMRASRVNGVHLVSTHDFKPNRINVAVESGKVIDTLSVG